MGSLYRFTKTGQEPKYVAKSGDASYQPSQRIIVKSDAVLDFADLLERLVNGMRMSLP